MQTPIRRWTEETLGDGTSQPHGEDVAPRCRGETDYE